MIIAVALYLNRSDLLVVQPFAKVHGFTVPALVMYREKSLALHADQPLRLAP